MQSATRNRIHDVKKLVFIICHNMNTITYRSSTEIGCDGKYYARKLDPLLVVFRISTDRLTTYLTQLSIHTSRENFTAKWTAKTHSIADTWCKALRHRSCNQYNDVDAIFSNITKILRRKSSNILAEIGTEIKLLGSTRCIKSIISHKYRYV